MDESTETTTRSNPPHERRREGRVQYNNPALIALLRQPAAPGAEATTTDAALLEQRFSLARRVRAYDAASALSEDGRHGRKLAVAELDACEAECRFRGLIR